MGVTRRKMLAFGGVGIVVVVVGAVLTRRIDDEVYRILRRNFDKRIANSSGAAEFVADIEAGWAGFQSTRNQILRPSFWMVEAVFPLARGERADLEKNVLEVFLRSTNAVRAFETGTEELQYLGLPNPEEDVCVNTFGAAWL